MKLLLLVTAALSLQAQTPPLPNYVFLGSDATASTTPKPAGIAIIALPLGAQTWSWSMYSAYVTTGKPPQFLTSTTTGLAKSLWCVSWACVVGLGAVGAATTGTATTSSFNAGGGVAFIKRFSKWPWLTPFVGVLQAKAGSSNQTQVVVAFGRSF